MTDRCATRSVPEPLLRKPLFLHGRWRVRRAAAVCVFASAMVMGACNGMLPSPGSDAAQGQAMMDLAETLNQIRDQSAGLQDQVDSLREVVLRQDTIIRQLAVNAGVPLPPSQ